MGVKGKIKRRVFPSPGSQKGATWQLFPGCDSFPFEKYYSLLQ
jgi:hypothetical protein